jgi:hypothetical protein
LDLSVAHNHTEVFDFSLLELTLLGLQVQIQVSQFTEDIVDFSSMSRKVLRFGFVRESLCVDYTIVHISRKDTSFDLWLELRIDHGLERGG